MIINKPDKLTANTKIIAQCEICGGQSNTLYRCHKRSITRHGLYRCFKCSVSTKEFSEKAKINSKLSSGNHSPLSIETKNKISNSVKLLMTDDKKLLISSNSKKLWNNDLFRQKVSGKLSKLWDNKEIKEKAITGIKKHIMDNPEFYAGIHQKKWDDEEYRNKTCIILYNNRTKYFKRIKEDEKFRNAIRQKASLTMKRLYIEGKMPITKGKSTIINSIKGGIFRTRSSYETAYVKILDNDNNVKEFKYEPFYIDYEHDGINKIYIPDFLVQYNDDHIEIVEIKPSKLINLDINQIKFKAAEKYSIINNMKFVVISEDKLNL